MDFKFNDMFEDSKGNIYYYVGELTDIDILKFGWNPYEIPVNAHIIVDVTKTEFLCISTEEIIRALKYIPVYS